MVEPSGGGGGGGGGVGGGGGTDGVISPKIFLKNRLIITKGRVSQPPPPTSSH